MLGPTPAAASSNNNLAPPPAIVERMHGGLPSDQPNHAPKLTVASGGGKVQGGSWQAPTGTSQNQVSLAAPSADSFSYVKPAEKGKIHAGGAAVGAFRGAALVAPFSKFARQHVNNLILMTALCGVFAAFIAGIIEKGIVNGWEDIPLILKEALAKGIGNLPGAAITCAAAEYMLRSHAYERLFGTPAPDIRSVKKPVDTWEDDPGVAFAG